MPTPDPKEKNRRCSRCGAEKPYTAEHWPQTKGQPVGTVCRTCSRVRRREFEKKYRETRVAARTHSLASLTAGGPDVPASQPKPPSHPEKRGAGELTIKQLEFSRALRTGAEVINRRSRWILARLLRYLHDPNHPHHEWAFKFVMERAMPRKLYEDLGAQAAGIDKSGAGRERPTVNIIVQPAAVPQAGEPSVRVIEHEG